MHEARGVAQQYGITTTCGCIKLYVFILDFYNVGFDQVFVLTYITLQVIDVAARFMMEDDEERSGVQSRFLFSPAFVVRNYLII